MVRGAFFVARLRVDGAGAAASGAGRAHQDQVDTQSVVAAEREHPVIPPAVRFFGLTELAEDVDQPDGSDVAERQPLRLAHVQ